MKYFFIKIKHNLFSRKFQFSCLIMDLTLCLLNNQIVNPNLPFANFSCHFDSFIILKITKVQNILNDHRQIVFLGQSISQKLLILDYIKFSSKPFGFDLIFYLDEIPLIFFNTFFRFLHLLNFIQFLKFYKNL